jgi:extracellular factor (EF) 3-hydroxypalmitic acid methyl ester biosynthesis protein
MNKKEKLTVDNKVKSKAVVKAEDIAFKVVKDKEKQLNGFYKDIVCNSAEEKDALVKAILVINSCVELIEKHSNISFNLNNYNSFKSEYCSYIDCLEAHACAVKDIKIIDKIKNIFRGKIYKYLCKSEISARAHGKPFGYPGDYLMLQYLYDMRVISEANIGKYFDRMYLDDPLTIAVINRVNVMANKVIEFIRKSDKKEIHILNIASGSGFDIKKVVSQKYGKKVKFYCVDQEFTSLGYIKSFVENSNTDIEFVYCKEDIKNFFKGINGDQSFDYIYNIGLADYLPDRVLKSLMQNCINTLSNNGQFVLAHKDYNKFPFKYPDWSVDWQFIHRSEEDYRNFIKNNLSCFSSFDISYESKKEIIYFGTFIK